MEASHLATCSIQTGKYLAVCVECGGVYCYDCLISASGAFTSHTHTHTHTHAHTRTHTQVFSRCSAEGTRNRRSAAAVVGDNNRNVEGIRERRFITKKQAPPAPIAEMNHSSYCIGSALPLFSSLPEKICSRTNINEGNTKCWTGGVDGRYVFITVHVYVYGYHNSSTHSQSLFAFS